MKRRVNAAAAGAATGLVGVTGVSAQSLRDRFFGGDEVAPDIASAGNGGVATASANGGAVSVADINSGGNAGSPSASATPLALGSTAETSPT